MDRTRFLEHQHQIESQIHQVWTPHSGQLEIAQAFFINWVIGVFMRCGRKFGKTEFAIYCMYMFAKLFENSECYYVADEKDHARDICWDNRRLPEFFTSFRIGKGESQDSFKKRKQLGKKLQKNWVTKINESEMYVRLDNNSMLKVDGAKNWKKADGLGPVFVVYDEFKNHDPRYDRAARPNLMDLNARILIIGTPPDNEDNYYCETEKEFSLKPNHLTFNRPSWMNPHVYNGPDCPKLKAEREALERKGELHVYLREYECQIVPDTKRQIFPMFEMPKKCFDTDKYSGRTKHFIPHELAMSLIQHRKKDWDFYCCFDAGSAKAFAVLLVAINKYTKQIIVIDEVYETEQARMTTKTIYDQALAKMSEVHGLIDDWYQIYDAAALWFANEVQAHYEDVALSPSHKDVKKKEAKLSLIKDIMLEDALMVISDRCQKFTWEVGNYAKDENGRIPKENDHALDCFRYILNESFYDTLFEEYLEEKSKRRFETPLTDLYNIRKGRI